MKIRSAVPAVVIIGLIIIFSCNATRNSGYKNSSKETSWQDFKKGFKTAHFPVVIQRESFPKLGDREKISYRFGDFVSEMKSGGFSRRGPKPVYYFTMVDDNPRFTTAIYAVQERIMSPGAPYLFKLVTYDNTGKILHEKKVAGQMYNDDPEFACTINSNMVIEIKSFKNIYKKDVNENGYQENKIDRQELVSTEYFKINSTGDFEKTTSGVAMN